MRGILTETRVKQEIDHIDMTLDWYRPTDRCTALQHVADANSDVPKGAQDTPGNTPFTTCSAIAPSPERHLGHYRHYPSSNVVNKSRLRVTDAETTGDLLFCWWCFMSHMTKGASK